VVMELLMRNSITTEGCIGQKRKPEEKKKARGRVGHASSGLCTQRAPLFAMCVTG
jgi:hypothetical protein